MRRAGRAAASARGAFGVLQREAQLLHELIDPRSAALPRAVGLEAHVADPPARHLWSVAPSARPTGRPLTCGLLCAALGARRRPHAGGAHEPASERRAFGVLQREAQLLHELIDSRPAALPRAVGL